MVEFNIQWSEGSTQELEEILRVVKASGLQDVHINVTRSVEMPSKKMSVPETRLRQIVETLNNAATPLTKRNLVQLLIQTDPSISELTASTYISSASGGGIIERTKQGYVATTFGTEKYLT